jgi:hypothetical protein
MIPINPSNIVAPLVSFALAAALTPVVRNLARRWGFVAKPKTDRWHKRPTAMMGGVAIWLAVIATDLALVPHTSAEWVVLGASSFLFLVGLADDWLHIKPYQKLIGQVIGAAAVVNYGLLLPWTRAVGEHGHHDLRLIGYECDQSARQHGWPGHGNRGYRIGLSHVQLFRDGSDYRSDNARRLHRGFGWLPDLQLESGIDLHGR